jgi:hypothetical protein
LPGRRENGKRPLSYYEILKRLNVLAAKKRKNEEVIAVETGRRLRLAAGKVVCDFIMRC